MESAAESSDCYTKVSACNMCRKKLKERVIPSCCLHKFCCVCEVYIMQSGAAEKKALCPICQKPFKAMAAFPVPSEDQWDLQGFRENWLRTTSTFRKKIYHQNAWVLDIANISKNCKELMPQFCRDSQSKMTRLSLWLKREITVLLDYCGSETSCDCVIQNILSMLHHHSIQSEEFKTALFPYFKKETHHFIHEFHTFANSPYDIHAFDEIAFYCANPIGMNISQMSEMNVYLDFKKEVFTGLEL